MQVANIIKVAPHTINVNDSIDKALALINSLKLNGIPVVNDNNKLVGMLVKADIYRFMIAPGHYDSCPVEWVMSKSVIIAQSDEDLLIVAKRLRENNIIAMPVVDKDDVVGIISIEDLLDYFISQ
ncbi:MAG TPA: CBS domain-containing protein [Clostridium sp.]